MVALILKLNLKLHYQKSWYAYYIILKTAFNTFYMNDKMSAISDSLKPFTPTITIETKDFLYFKDVILI